LVLKNNTFFVESRYPDILRELLKNPNIKNARVVDSIKPADEQSSINNLKENMNTTTTEGFLESLAPREDRREVELLLLDEDIHPEDEVDGIDEQLQQSMKTVSFMISQSEVQVHVY
jgi:hypothetical protein